MYANFFIALLFGEPRAMWYMVLSLLAGAVGLGLCERPFVPPPHVCVCGALV